MDNFVLLLGLISILILNILYINYVETKVLKAMTKKCNEAMTDIRRQSEWLLKEVAKNYERWYSL